MADLFNGGNAGQGRMPTSNDPVVLATAERAHKDAVQKSLDTIAGPLGRHEGRQRRENYAAGVSKLKEGMFGLNIQAGSPLYDMKKTGSILRSYDVSNAVPRRDR